MDLPKISFRWKRPLSVPYPNTWHRFTTRQKDGKTYNIKIIDLTPDRFEESLQFMIKYFYPEEPLNVSLDLLLKDEISFRGYLQLQRVVSENRTSLLAVLDEDVPKPEIVGLQKLSVESKEDLPISNVTGDIMKRRCRIVKDITKDNSPFDVLNTDVFVHDRGLCVKPEYRGLDIGYNIILAVEKLAKAFDIRGFMMNCTSLYSQKLAKKAGLKVCNEIVYDEYRDENGQMIFPVQSKCHKSFKLMMIEYS